MLRADQEAFEVQRSLKEEELRIKKREHIIVIFSSIFIITLCLTTAVFYRHLYRKKRDAYKTLVNKGLEWAESDYYPAFNTQLIDTGNIKEEEEYDDDCINDIEFEMSCNNTSLFERLRRVMAEKKLYSDPNLSLLSLSVTLGVNRSYISRAINATTGANFNSFVNEYRVKEAIKLLSEPNNCLSISDICYEVGFNSRSSFYSSFKKYTGLTPKEFRENILY